MVSHSGIRLHAASHYPCRRRRDLSTNHSNYYPNRASFMSHKARPDHALQLNKLAGTDAIKRCRLGGASFAVLYLTRFSIKANNNSGAAGRCTVVRLNRTIKFICYYSYLLIFKPILDLMLQAVDLRLILFAVVHSVHNWDRNFLVTS